MTAPTPNVDPAAFHTFEQKGWERAAEHYADTFGGLTAGMAPALLDAVRLEPGARLLDVACGPGFVSGAAAERGAVVTGVDFSPAMVAEAHHRHPALVFRLGDADALPFPDATFNAVVMNFGMLHLARPEVAIGEAYRVLAPGGRYAFSVWAPPEQAAGFGMVLRAIEAFGRPDVGLPPGPPFFQFADAAATTERLTRFGFEDVDVRTVPLTWKLPSADALFEAFSKGGVRTSAVLRAQTPEALEKIKAAMRLAAEEFVCAEGTCELPMPAVLASAVRLG